MNINEVFSCPCCKGNSIHLASAGVLLSPVVTNTFVCKDCGAEWRAYWLVTEQCVEIMSTGVSSAPEEITSEVEL